MRNYILLLLIILFTGCYKKEVVIPNKLPELNVLNYHKKFDSYIKENGESELIEVDMSKYIIHLQTTLKTYDEMIMEYNKLRSK